MTEEHGFPILVDGFMSVSDDAFCDEPDLRWYCAPDSWEDSLVEGRREGRDGSWTVDDDGQLVVKPPAKKDFWRKTYYSPTLVKDDGPCLFATVQRGKAVMAETSFTISGNTRQFDQAGICVRMDSEHWLKTGIEIVDGIPRLSCVCTNSYSDWSTQKYWNDTATNVRIRVHVLPNRSVVVEAWEEASKTWNFIRICYLSRNVKVDPDPMAEDEAVTKAWSGKAAPSGHVYVGVFACCPEDQTGTVVTFHDLSVVAGSTFKHDADGIHEK
jgi:regulation of enolase protein 1 (concanavalin A-like superfamily)